MIEWLRRLIPDKWKSRLGWGASFPPPTDRGVRNDLKDLPYFRWFAKDAETDETYLAMTDEECGFYHRCLNVAWTNNGIPADPADRARVLRRNRNQADARWTARVASCFVPHEQRSGYLVNARQEHERVHAKHKSVKATESVNVRYERSTSENGDVASRALARAVSDSVSDSSSVLESKNSNQNLVRAPDDDFHRYTEVCDIAGMHGSETDLIAAHALWVLLSIEDKLAACAGIKARVAAGEYDNPSFRPLLQNYLQKKIWQRTIRERDAGLDKSRTKRNEVLQLSKMFTAMRNGTNDDK